MATTSSFTVSRALAAADTAKLKLVATAGSAGSTLRFSLYTVPPETRNSRAATPPRSAAETTAFTCCPGFNLTPVTGVVKATCGGVASKTVMATAWALLCSPLVSIAVALTVMVEPGSASTGT